MPTGYTADVQDGKVTTLAAFLRECARGFVLDLRDADHGDPIPRTSAVQQSSVDYARKCADEALAEIHRLHGLSATEAERGALAEFNLLTERLAERQRRREETRERYTAMLTQVRAWQATTGLQNIRSFMIEQLENSIKWDCTGYEFDAPPDKLSGPDWLEKRIAAKQSEHMRALESLAEAEARLKKWNSFYGELCDELERLEGQP